MVLEGPDITVSGYGTSTFLALLTFRYSGVATYNPLDQTSSKSGTGNAISTNSITTTRANELLIAGVCQSASSSLSGWTNSFTVRSGIQGSASSSYAERIVSSTGTYSTSVTASQNGAWRAHMASFKAVTKTWDGGAGTTNWGDANNWNPNGVPASTDVLELTGANTIDINVAGQCMDIYMNNSGLTLTVKSGQSLTVGGNLTMLSGTLKTEASFPTVSGTTTLGATSTVEYNGAAQTIAAKNYGHLTLSNTGTKTFANGTSGIAGTFTISGSATAQTLGGTCTIDYNGSGAQTVRAIGYNNLTLSNAGTKTFASGVTTVYAAFTISGSAAADATTNSTTISYNGPFGQTIASDQLLQPRIDQWWDKNLRGRNDGHRE